MRRVVLLAALLLLAGVAVAQDVSNLRATAGTASVYAQWHGSRSCSYDVRVCDTGGNMVQRVISASMSALVCCLAPNSSYLLIVAPQCSGIAGAADSVTFSTASLSGGAQCAPPQLVAPNSSPGTIALEWAAGYRDSVWKLEYKRHADAVWLTALGSTTRTSYSLSGLVAGTAYDVRLTPICSGTAQSTAITVPTPCASAALPFLETFDTCSASASSYASFPACWQRPASATAASNNHVFITTAYRHSDSNSLLMSSSASDCDYAAMPYVHTSADSLIVSFWLYGRTSGAFHVGVMSDPTDPGTFVSLWTVSPVDGVWQFVELPLSAYTGSGHYVAFMSYAGETCNINIDDAGLELLPDCMWPTDMAFVDITPNSCTMRWHSYDSPDLWAVEYDTVPLGTQGATPTTLYAYDTLYTLGQLQPATTYYVGLYAYCGTASSRRVSGSFRTACHAVTPPLRENFDTWTVQHNGGIDSCWYGGTDFFTGTATYPRVSTTYSHSGSQSLYLYSPVGYFSYLVSPYMAIQSDSLTLSFWLYWANNTTTDYLELGVMDNPADVRTFTPVYTVRPRQSSAWEYFEVPLQGSGTSHYVALMAPRDHFCNPFVDDLSIVRTNTCPPPLNLRARSVAHDGCVLSWSTQVAPARWVIEYSTTGGFRPGTGTVLYSSGTTCRLSGLTPNTTYYVYVQGECASDTSYRREVSFTTQCLPTWPPIRQNFDHSSMADSCYRTLSSYRPDFPQVTGSIRHSGSNSLWLYSTNSTYSCYVLPPVAAEIDSLRLSLDVYKSTSYYTYKLMVGVMSDPNNIATFSVVDSVVLSTASVWTHYDVPLLHYTGVGQCVALLAPSGALCDLYIDDIVLDYAPPCAVPTGIWVPTQTTTSVTLAWDAMPAAMGYVVSLASASGTPQSGVMQRAATNRCQLNGLQSLVRYSVYIRTVCGVGDSSAWAGPFAITPGSHNMRAGRTDTLMICGSILYDDGGPTGNYTPNRRSVVILRPQGTQPVRIHGSMQCSGGTSLDICDGYGWNTFTRIASLRGTHATVGPYTASNPDGVLTLDFMSGSADMGFELYVTCVDDYCFPVDTLMLSGATHNSATLQWTPGGSENSWEIIYDTTLLFTTADSVTVTGSPSCTLTGLVESTTYVVRVRPLCSSGDTGDVRTIIFATTPAPCDVPASITTDATTPTSASVSWRNAGSSQFNVEYKESNSLQWGNTMLVADSVCTFYNLTPATSYDWRICRLCSSNRQSFWVAASFVTDSASGGLGIGTAPLPEGGTELVVYPNPAPQGSDITVSLPCAESDATLQLFDITGRLLHTIHPQSNHPTQSNQSNQFSASLSKVHRTFFMFHLSPFTLSKGTYFIKATTPSATFTRKIIVR